MIQTLIKNYHLQKSKIGQYLNLRIFGFFAAITFLIFMIVFGNQFILTVRESVERGIPFQELLPIISLNMLRDIPLIVTLSLFLSIILSISQLYKNSEAVVMNSIGLGRREFAVIIQPIVFLIFFIMIIFTAYIIPAAKYEKNIIENKAENSSEFSFITEGEFENFKNGEIVFFASNSKTIDDDLIQNMEEIFIYAFNNNVPIIIIASEAQKYLNSENKGTYLRLKDGIRYEGFPSSENKKILEFDLYDLEIISGEVKDAINISRTIESLKTQDLLSNGDNLSLAELQWRFSQPISLLILSFIGVFLGKTSPRSSKGLGLIFGVAIFIVYNNGLLLCKSAIENGGLNPFLGFFGIHFLIITVFLLIYKLTELNLYNFIDKMSFFNPSKKKYHA
jgi:lipopolysaccharide export system permease protein